MLKLIGIDKDFLNRTQVAQLLRGRIDKWDNMKLKSFCTMKEIVIRLKWQPTEWEKILARYTSDKGLITGIHREVKKLNFPQINDPIKKWGNELNRAVSKEKVQMTRKHMKKCSTSLAIRKMQIKTTLRFYLTPVKKAVIENIHRRMEK
jgi:hypothetical protein